MTAAELLRTLDRWREAGWLRGLDVAFARWLGDVAPEAPASLLLAAALAAQMEGRGHSGLPLAALVADPRATLDWPLESTEELAGALSSAFTDAFTHAFTDAFTDAGTDAGTDAFADVHTGAFTGAGAFVDTRTDGPRAIAALRAAWGSQSAVEIDPTDEAGASPLVLTSDLLQLRRHWRDESRVAAQVRARTAFDGGTALPAPGGVDLARARDLLGRMFGAVDAGDGESTDWQQVACALALRGRLTLVTGGPGTGKTYTAARLLVLLRALHPGPHPLRVALAAPTGKAAARLRQSISKALQALRERLGATLPLDAWAQELGPARTLHSLLGTLPGTRRFRHDATHPLEVDVLFVDEASMVHLEMMARLLEALAPGARLVLLGDKDQLASVEAGAVMGDLCHGAGAGGVLGGYRPETAAWVEQVTGQVLPAAVLGPGPALAQQTVMLRKSHRFEGPIGRLALAVNAGDAPGALALLRERTQGEVALVEARDAAAALPLAVQGRAGASGESGDSGASSALGAAGGYRGYLECLATRPAEAAAFEGWARDVLRRFERFRVLCVVREGAWGVAGLNAAIERALAEAALLPRRRGEWYEGRPVMVTRNSPELGIFNGDVGVVLRSSAGDGALRGYFLDGDELRSVSVGRLADVETAFAMTVHKSQGSEFEHVLLVLPDEDVPVLTRELLYTGITRASRAFTLLCAQPGSLAVAVGRLTRRVSGLRNRLA